MCDPSSCPMCGSTKIHPQKDEIISPHEKIGIVYDERKTGCYDWQYSAVGYKCDKKHLFWVRA